MSSLRRRSGIIAGDAAKLYKAAWRGDAGKTSMTTSNQKPTLSKPLGGDLSFASSLSNMLFNFSKAALTYISPLCSFVHVAYSAIIAFINNCIAPL